jgi:hypothetical protein
MRNPFMLRALCILAALAAAACSSNSNDTTSSSDSGGDADASEEGENNEAGTASDAGGDSGRDATQMVDATGDTTTGPEASSEAGPEAAVEAGNEASTEAGNEASTGTEAGAESGTEAGTDGGTEAGTPCAYASTILADNPLAYLRFDEASGTTAADLTGNGNTGTYTGAFTLGAPGAIPSCPGSTAVTLDGNSGWVDLGDKFGFTGAAPFSLELWINASTINAEFRGLLTKHSTPATGREGYDLFSVDGVQYRTALGFERYQAGVWQTAGIAPAAADGGAALAPIVGTWMHIVAVFDGTNEFLYTNGALVAGPIASPQVIQTQGGCSFAVGKLACDATGGNFAGTVDEVAVYGTALSAAQVQAHFLAAQGAGNGVIVINPANGATVSNPILIQALATESVTVNQVQVWDNGNKLGAYPNPNVGSGAMWQYFTQSYTLSSGTHATTVMDLDNSYNVITKTTVNYTVQ